jgi:branched-chain amino acid transport system ATP-binding protein
VTAALVELAGVHAAYGDIPALHGVDLRIDEGTVVALLGPNGAGKSSTVKVCSGLLAPTAGAVVVGGQDVTGASPDALSRLGVCTVPEGRGVFPNLTVAENLWMATHAGAARRHVEDVTYGRFPRLAERRSQLAGTLSGGEQQMLALSRALATDPAVILLDELSMGLAPIVVGELYEIVRQVAATGVALLVVEQFAEAVLRIADVAAVMAHGRVTAIGTPADMQAGLSHAYLGADPR